MDIVERFLRSHGALIGRVFVGFLFFFSGLQILVGGVGVFSGMIDARGIPFALALAWVVVIFKIVAGGALIVGYKTKWAALGLIDFTILATLLFHLSLQDINLFKNLAIIGGLLYIYVYGPGNGWRLKDGPISAL